MKSKTFIALAVALGLACAGVQAKSNKLMQPAAEQKAP